MTLEYCRETAISGIDRDDLSKLGIEICRHFKNIWTASQPLGPVANSGFINVEEGGRRMLVVGYPEAFKIGMRLIIAGYFKRKEETVNKPHTGPNRTNKEPESSGRKRVPVKSAPVKVTSSKDFRRGV